MTWFELAGIALLVCGMAYVGKLVWALVSGKYRDPRQNGRLNLRIFISIILGVIIVSLIVIYIQKIFYGEI